MDQNKIKREISLHEALQERGILRATKDQRAQPHGDLLAWDFAVAAIVIPFDAWFLLW
jgi:hypothetical protein